MKIYLVNNNTNNIINVNNNINPFLYCGSYHTWNWQQKKNYMKNMNIKDYNHILFKMEFLYFLYFFRFRSFVKILFSFFLLFFLLITHSRKYCPLRVICEKYVLGFNVILSYAEHKVLHYHSVEPT